MNWDAALNAIIFIVFFATMIYFVGSAIIAFERVEKARAITHFILWAITMSLFIGWMSS